MALIWASGFEGERSLAKAWRTMRLAQIRAEDTAVPVAELGAAMIASLQAKTAYDALISEVEASFQDTSTSSTHAFVVGVGRYEIDSIPALTTSVHGAYAFIEWLLRDFRNPDAPLASIDLYISEPEDFESQFSTAADALVGLEPGTTMPTEPAKFQTLKDGFTRFAGRGSRDREDQAFVYFAGHGLWKGDSLLLPEDAVVGSSFDRLINLDQTQSNFANSAFKVQCYFVDACQQVMIGLQQDLTPIPGRPLREATTGPRRTDLDSRCYLASTPAKAAFGLPEKPPFFTEELLNCFRKRGAESEDEGSWIVTTDSLGKALRAACIFRSQVERKDINFRILADTVQGANLCIFQGMPEIFVTVKAPPDALAAAILYVESNGIRTTRRPAEPREWCAVVGGSIPIVPCIAGADFDPPTMFASVSKQIVPFPPVSDVRLQPRGA